MSQTLTSVSPWCRIDGGVQYWLPLVDRDQRRLEHLILQKNVLIGPRRRALE